MAIIKLKPLNRKDPIFTSHFMTFSNKKRRKNERQTDKIKTRKKKVNWFKDKKLLFLESIGNHRTPRDVKLKNLIKVLEKNGFVIKNKK